MIPQPESGSSRKEIAIKRAGLSWKPMSKPCRISAPCSSRSKTCATPKDRSQQVVHHHQTRFFPLPTAIFHQNCYDFSQPRVEGDEMGHPPFQFTEARGLPPFLVDLWLRVPPRAFIVAAEDPRLSMTRYCTELFSEIRPPPITLGALYPASLTSQLMTWHHQPRDFPLEAFQQTMERAMPTSHFPPIAVAARATHPHYGTSTELVIPETREHQEIRCNDLERKLLKDQPQLSRANSSLTIPNSGVTLARPEDRGMLNDNLIFLRHQIEYFPATADDIMCHRNKSIAPGQVGIRCRHCSRLAAGQRRKGSTYFPSTLMRIYQAAQNINIEHLQSGVCQKIPHEVKLALIRTRANKTAASGIGKAYWAESARTQGLVDTEDGIRFAVDAARSRSLMLQPSTHLTQFSTRNL